MTTRDLSAAIRLGLFCGLAGTSAAALGAPSFGDNIITTMADGAGSAVPVDLNGDGFVDILATAAVDSFQLRWYENNGGQSFTQRDISANMPFAYSAVAIDVDGDGHLDIVAASQYFDKVSWFENDGAENFSERTVTTMADGANSVFAVDLDGDTDIDILSASRFDDTIAWYENDGNENFTPHDISTSADLALRVTAADLDGDGDMDVLSASAFDDKIAWYENDGEENFTVRTISASAVDASAVAVADLDGDGDRDVLSASSSDNKIAWYENDGEENFSERTISTSAIGAFAVTAADLDGDGDVDVASASVLDSKVAWYENDGSQNFTPRTISVAGLNVGSIEAGDIDSDGDLDLVSASGSDDTITWHRNNSVGIRILDIAARELPPVIDFTGNYGAGWFFQSLNCGTATVDETTTTVTLTTSNCIDSVANYTHFLPGAPADGVVSFSWTVSDNNSHQYVAEAGVNGGEAWVLADSQPGSGVSVIPVLRGQGIFFEIFNDQSIGEATLEISDFRFGQATTAIIVERGVGDPFTVNVATIPGSAAGNEDFGLSAAVGLPFSGFDGETKLFTVAIVDDAEPEVTENFFIQLDGLVAPTNHVLLNGGRAEVTIAGNDPRLTIDAAAVVDEGQSGTTDLQVAIRLEGDIVLEAGQFSAGFYDWSLSEGTATSLLDYDVVAAGASLGEAPDGTVIPVNLGIVGDLELENDENFFVNLNVDSSLVGSGNTTAEITIRNDDAIVAASGMTVSEGDDFAFVDVQISGRALAGTVVSYETSDGSFSEFFGEGATAGEDYQASSGILSFGGFDGETQQVAIPIIDDDDIEQTEWFGFNITGTTNGVAALADFSSISFIEDNDVAQPPTDPPDPETPPIDGADADDRAGSSVSLADGGLAVGVPGADTVAFYELAGGAPVLAAQLEAPGDAVPGFGSQVALDEGFLVIGTGGATLAKGGCSEGDLTAQILERLALGFQGFGDVKGDQSCGGGDVAVDEGVVFVGSTLDVSVASFILAATGGVLDGPVLFPPFGKGNGFSRFGIALDAKDGKLAVGAPGTGEGGDVGTVSLYRIVPGGFTGIDIEPASVAVLLGDPGDLFGRSVAFSDAYLVVGMPRRNDNDGAVRIYDLATLFDEGRKGAVSFVDLDPPAADEGGRFGTSVAISGNNLFVGGPTFVTPNGSTGATYLYELDDLVATLRDRTLSPPGADEFGNDVAIDEDGTTATGAPGTEEEEGTTFVSPGTIFRDGFEDVF